jgi:2-isopropylmalate synthase
VALTATALSAGAQIINISDTTGTATPEQIKNLIQGLYEAVPELSDAVVSLHGHNHVGRATENALAAITNEVRQLEGTINGVGPAGGNTDLVDVAQILTPIASQIGIEFDADVNRLRSLSNEPYFRI